jgi:hypothetical protein
MTIKSLFATAAVLALLGGGASYAQSPAATNNPAATSTDKAAKPKKERSAKSIECSKQADAKGLHGKERKKFRAQCKKG